MRKIYLLIMCLGLVHYGYSQMVLLNEDFEGTTNAFTTTSESGNATPWSLSSTLANGGLFSDSNSVQLNDTIYLTSNSFSTSSLNNVYLEFYQIAKIDLFDKALVEVSADNGTSWTALTANQYQGGSSVFGLNDYFSSLSYSTWKPGSYSAKPDSNWWKKEAFDISTIANSAGAMIRFVLIDANANGARGAYGWLLDDIKVIGAACEMVLPTISLIAGPASGPVYAKGPYKVSADIQDASGVSSAKLHYTKNGGPIQSLSMVNTSGPIYEAYLPAMKVGDTICYHITATDNSQCLNVASAPANGCTKFIVTSGTPNFCVGNVESSYPYTENFDSFITGFGSNPGTFKNNWQNSTSAADDWYVEDFSTSSLRTGPDNDHTTGSGKYVYVEASGISNKTAVLESPCFDLSGYGKKRMGFWVHMYGASMGSLHVDIETFNGLVQNVMIPISGNKGNSWYYQEIDLSAYQGSIIKVHFRGLTGNGFQSDMAIDDFTIYEVPADVGMQALISPSASGCSVGSSEYVTVSILNAGSELVDSVPVAYRLNSGSIVRDTAFINISPNSSAYFTFQQTVNLTNLTSYSFDIWTELDNDGDKGNDSLLNMMMSPSPKVINLPDTQDFEAFTVGKPGIFADGWTNDPVDANDWYAHSGSTPTISTGPSGDTTTIAGTGQYLYVDASVSTGQFASVYSPCIDFGSMLKPRMKFFYHMNGADMGKLHIDVQTNGIRFNDVVPPLSGDKGNKWHEKTIDLSQFAVTAKVIFRSEKGNGVAGDIAIDNIIFFDQPVGTSEPGSLGYNEIKLYPNPAKNLVQLSIDEELVGGLLTISSVSGKPLLTKVVGEDDIKIDIHDLKAGLHIVSYCIKGRADIIKKLIIY